MLEKKTMRALVAVLVVTVVASLVVGVVARHRHHSHGDPGGRNGAGLGGEERHSRRSASRRGGGRGYRDPLEQAFIAHMDRVKSFRCRDPVPKALSVLSLHEEMSWRPAIHEEIEPENTILHRCGDSSGCCHNHMHSCQPMGLEEVTLVFSVRDTMTGRMKYEEATATNHTRCGCLEKSYQPK